MPLAGDLTLFEKHTRASCNLASSQAPSSSTQPERRYGADSTAEMLADRFGAHLDTELSTHKGIVVVKGDEVYVAFRGAQANPPRPELQSYTDIDKANIKRALLGKRLDLSGEEAIVRGAME
eukprot:895200-Pleurochrysis_carterae.AAC.1